MSVHVYLRGDEVRGLPGFTVEPKRDGDGNRWEDYNLPGITPLWHKNGRWYITLDRLTDPIPAAVADIVAEISFIGFIPMYPKREAGIYRYKSAEAEIRSGMEQAEVHIRAKKMGDVLELSRKIKTGSIRPDESYEGEQGGKSRQEIEAELEKANRSLAAMEAEVERVQRIADEKRMSLRTYLFGLRSQLVGGWPFCTKKWVGDRIDGALSR